MIRTVASSGPKDQRKPFPREGIALVLRGEKKEILLETPVSWRKRERAPLEAIDTYEFIVEFEPSLTSRLHLSAMNSVLQHGIPKNMFIFFEPFGRAQVPEGEAEERRLKKE